MKEVLVRLIISYIPSYPYPPLLSIPFVADRGDDFRLSPLDVKGSIAIKRTLLALRRNRTG